MVFNVVFCVFLFGEFTSFSILFKVLISFCLQLKTFYLYLQLLKLDYKDKNQNILNGIPKFNEISKVQICYFDGKFLFLHFFNYYFFLDFNNF